MINATILKEIDKVIKHWIERAKSFESKCISKPEVVINDVAMKFKKEFGFYAPDDCFWNERDSHGIDYRTDINENTSKEYSSIYFSMSYEPMLLIEHDWKCWMDDYWIVLCKRSNGYRYSILLTKRIETKLLEQKNNQAIERR